jgi:HK97 family phage major capsid protein
MTTANQTIMQKADMQVADLISDGGYLQDEQANKFVVDLIKDSVMMKMVDVRGLKSHTQIIDKVGINGRVLRPGTSGKALAAGDRVQPDTDQIELNTHLLKGEIRLNDEVLEDNIEGGTFKSTVMSMMSEHVALDMDDLLVNGDTTSTDPLLAILDGMLVGATSHIVNGGTQPISKSMLKAAVKAMPSQYNRAKAKQRFLTSEDAEVDYRDYLSDRATVLGDKFMQDDAPIRYANRPIMGIPVFPDNLGGGNDSTNILLTDPKNARWGVWRKVRVETDRDITTGEWIMVITVRCGFVWKEEDAVVKVTNVKTQ